MSIPVSHCILPPSLPGNHKIVFYICDSFCLENKFICTIFQDSTYKRYHVVFILFCLHSLWRSLGPPMLLQALFHPFLWLSTFHCKHVPHHLYSSVNGYLDCFHVLAILNSTVINFGVHVSFQIMIFSVYILKKGSAGSYVALFLVCHSGCINLYSYQECRRVPFSSHSFQNLWKPLHLNAWERATRLCSQGSLLYFLRWKKLHRLPAKSGH